MKTVMVNRKLFAVVAILLIGLTVLGVRASQAESKQSLDVSAARPISTIPVLPIVNPSRPLQSRATEYRASTDPQMQDVYCANSYGSGSYTYQFIGQTPANNPTLRCHN